MGQLRVFMTITTVLISPVISYVTLKARTVLAAAIMHGTFNAVFVISIMVVAGGSDLTVGMTGLAGFITLSILIVGLMAYDRWIASEPIGDPLDSYRTSPV